MKKDYHIHAQVLTRPDGVSGFLETAAARGLTEICITDHMPLIGNSAGDRIPAGQVGQYCETVRKLAEQYAPQLSVKLGIEIDFHPTLLPQIRAVLEEGEFDYVLGSSHLHVLPDTFAVCRTQSEYAIAMLENTCLAAESGLFDAIAHMDMYRWIFSRPDRFPLAEDCFSEASCTGLINEVLDTMKAHHVRLEINPHFAQSMGNRTEYVYPGIYITEMALQKGISFVYGSDAHKSKDVGAMLPELCSHPVYGKALTSMAE